MKLSRNILAIDTAMNGCSASVYCKPRQQFFTRSHEMTRGHAETLMPMIEAALHESGLQYSNLDMIVVTIGPGAFTGLRLGLSAARALALALNIGVVGLSTLDILARQYSQNHKGPFAVLIETKRDDYYVQRYDENGVAITKPQALDGKSVQVMLAPGSIVVGDAVERFAQGHAGFKTVSMTLPSSEIMCVMADENLGVKPEPLYLRDADVTMPKTAPRHIIMT